MLNNNTDFVVNLDLVVSAGDRYIIAPDMAMLIKMNGLMTVGSLLKSIEDEKLTSMVEFIEATYEEDIGNDTCHEELMLVSLMMIQAEGGQLPLDPDIAIQAVSQTLLFIMMESLYRKGLIELHHENMSYDEAVSNRRIARATPKGLDFVKRGGEDD